MEASHCPAGTSEMQFLEDPGQELRRERGLCWSSRNHHAEDVQWSWERAPGTIALGFPIPCSHSHLGLWASPHPRAPPLTTHTQSHHIIPWGLASYQLGGPGRVGKARVFVSLARSLGLPQADCLWDEGHRSHQAGFPTPAFQLLLPASAPQVVAPRGFPTPAPYPWKEFFFTLSSLTHSESAICFLLEAEKLKTNLGS